MTPSLEVQEENKQGTILQTKILARIFYPLFDEISNFTEAFFFFLFFVFDINSQGTKKTSQSSSLSLRKKSEMKADKLLVRNHFCTILNSWRLWNVTCYTEGNSIVSLDPLLQRQSNTHHTISYNNHCVNKSITFQSEYNINFQPAVINHADFYVNNMLFFKRLQAPESRPLESERKRS